MGAFGRDLLHVFRKELLHLARDKRSQVLTFVLPIIATGAFALSFAGQNFQPGEDPIPFPMAVKDLDRTAESQGFLEALTEVKLFTLHILPPEVDSREYMLANNIFATLTLPEGFAQSFRDGNPEIDFFYDNSKPYVGILMFNRVKIVLEAVQAAQNQAVTVNLDTLLTGQGNLDVFTPGIIVLLVTFTSLNDMSTSLVRERTEGTQGRVFLSPMRKGEYLGGKILTGIMLAIFRTLIILGIAVAFLGFQLRGSLLALFGIVILISLVTLGIGILLAARAKSEREVMVATLLMTIVLMFMMGAITPVDLMDSVSRFVANAIPHTHATEALRRLMLVGVPLGDEWRTLSILGGSALLAIGGGSVLYRRRID